MTAASALRLDPVVPAKTKTRANQIMKDVPWIGIVFLFALVLRLLYLYQAPQTPIIGDAAKYYEAGRALALGATSEEIWPLMVSRGPVYPLFLSAIFSFFAVDPWPVRIIQAVISALSCALVYLVGRQLVNRSGALIAGFMMAIFPNLIFYSGRILTETLSIFLFWLGIAALIRSLHNHASYAKSQSTSGRSPYHQPKGATHAQPNNRPDAVTFNDYRRGNILWLIISGAAIGSACITRSTLLPNVPFLVLAIWLGMQHSTKMHRAKMAGIFCACIFGIALAWNLWATTIGQTQTTASARGIKIMAKCAVQAASPLVRGWAPDTKPAHIVEHWGEVLEQNPFYPVVAAANLIFCHLWYADNSWREEFLLSPAGMNQLQRLIFILSLAGMGVALVQWRRFAPLLALIPPFVYLSVKWIELRHNLPFLPVIFLFAAIFAVNLINAIKKYSGQKKNLLKLTVGLILTGAILAISRLTPSWLCGHPIVWGELGDAAIMALGLFIGGILYKLTAPWSSRTQSLLIGFVPAILFIILFGSYVAVGSEPRWHALHVNMNTLTDTIVQEIHLPGTISFEQVESAMVLLDLQSEMDSPPLKVGVNGTWLPTQLSRWQEWSNVTAQDSVKPTHKMSAVYTVFSKFANRSLATWPQWWGLRIDPAVIGGKNVLSFSLAWRDQASGFAMAHQVKLGGTYSREINSSFYGPSINGLSSGAGTSIYRWGVIDDWRLWETTKLASLFTRSYLAQTDSSHRVLNSQLGIRLLVKFKDGRQLIY